ncbi:permease [Exiguobacterium sp. KKBO11]|uniref:5'-methylthioadenosine/S-adenosylhomocysteine nucleosidase family protein n=1 Tax=Exiguobacterium sp. KKBO11 TaxID=1805000 RepID=UPI0007D868AB|nr:permease [Exiguobacterium sp. KKBO11]OAI87341.1 permease [Exiguobacterium sp. KKBO11]
MIGISIATTWEFDATLAYFHVSPEDRITYPYGEYFTSEINGKTLLFYSTGVRKVNGIGANQYMILRFSLTKVIVAGTCAGIDSRYDVLDIIVADRAVQYDCTVKEIEPLIKPSFVVNLDVSKYGNDFHLGTIGTADRAVVMWRDYIELRDNGLTIADTEAGAIAYICQKNAVECIIIKGISDFPTEEKEENAVEANVEQMRIYIENTPKVMQRIFADYLYRFLT